MRNPSEPKKLTKEKLTESLGIIGLSPEQWNKTPEKKRSQLFEESMENELKKLTSAVNNPALDQETKNKHQENINLVNEIFNNPDLTKTDAETQPSPAPLPEIKKAPKKPDQGGKSWADIMNEMTALPSSEQLEWGWDAIKILGERLEIQRAQKELFEAAERYIKDPENNPPVDGIPEGPAELTIEQKLDQLIKEWGPKGQNIEDAVEKNQSRKVMEANWKKDAAEAEKLKKEQIEAYLAKERVDQIAVLSEMKEKAEEKEERRKMAEEEKISRLSPEQEAQIAREKNAEALKAEEEEKAREEKKEGEVEVATPRKKATPTRSDTLVLHTSYNSGHYSPGSTNAEARKNALKSLGFKEDAEPTQKEIESKWRKTSRTYHPDKMVGKGPKEQDEAKEKFLKLTEAKEKLLADLEFKHLREKSSSNPEKTKIPPEMSSPPSTLTNPNPEAVIGSVAARVDSNMAKNKTVSEQDKKPGNDGTGYQSMGID